MEENYSDQKVYQLLRDHIGLEYDDELTTDTVEEHLAEFTKCSHLLASAKTIIWNMATPNHSFRWWKPWASRWAISSEPLRADAANWVERLLKS